MENKIQTLIQMGMSKEDAVNFCKNIAKKSYEQGWADNTKNRNAYAGEEYNFDKYWKQYES